jgi:hypothetical protein
MHMYQCLILVQTPLSYALAVSPITGHIHPALPPAPWGKVLVRDQTDNTLQKIIISRNSYVTSPPSDPYPPPLFIFPVSSSQLPKDLSSLLPPQPPPLYQTAQARFLTLHIFAETKLGTAVLVSTFWVTRPQLPSPFPSGSNLCRHVAPASGVPLRLVTASTGPSVAR